VSDVSEAELQEWLKEQDTGAEGPGRGATSVPPHARLHGVCRNGIGAGRRLSFVLSFVLHARFPFFCNSLGAHLIFWGQAWVEGKGELATCRHCADSGQETDCT